MKIRLGFVSNSSSASYYVTVRSSWSDFVSKVLNKCWYPFFETESLMERVNNLIQNREWSITSAEQGEEHWLRPTLAAAKEELEQLKQDRKFLEDNQADIWDKTPEERDRLVRLAFKAYGINWEYEEGTVKMDYTTVMHNNFTESMPEALIEIILYYKFEEREAMSLRVDHDD